MNDQQPVNKSDSRLKEIGLIIGLNLIWVLIALLAVSIGLRSYTLSTTGNVVEGTVVRLLEDDKAAFDSDFTPVVEYRVAGQTYTAQSQNNYRWWNRYLRFWVGAKVNMLYDPAKPESAEVNSFLDLWFEPILLLIVAYIVARGVNAYLRYRRRSRQAAPISV